MTNGGVMVGMELAERLVRAHRDLFTAEARIAEVLGGSGQRIAHSLIDQWPTLEEYLHLYGGALTPAGVLVLGGRPDVGSAQTGIPFTGPWEARRTLGLRANGNDRSPAGPAFWGAVSRVQEHMQGAPLEGLFSTVLLSHAIPFSIQGHPPALFEAAAQHLRSLLAIARPQIVVAAGSDALAMLGHAISDDAVEDLARVDESTWLDHWKPGSRVSKYPTADYKGARLSVVPVPSLAGEHAERSAASIEAILAYAWV